MTRWRRAILVGLGLLVVTVGPASAQDDDLSRATLRRLPWVAVLVERLGEDAERDGLHQADTRTDVELALRLAGITVVTPVEAAVAAAGPMLDVQVGTLKDVSGSYAFSVVIGLARRVTLASGSQAQAVTWSAGNVGIAGAQRVADAARGLVKDRVDQFINAWLAVNPKAP